MTGVSIQVSDVSIKRSGKVETTVLNGGICAVEMG